LVGLLLGDLCIRKATQSSNPRCQFKQGLIHKEYLSHLYDLFQNYCGTGPKITNRKPDPITNQVYSSVSFTTISLPCFNEYYNLFYPKGQKVVPKNIGDLLTPAGLAF
jgi:hypothetical protein